MKKTRSVSPAAAMVARINTSLRADVVGLGSDPRFSLEKIPSGSLVIDRITGGGFPRGRHVELFGDENAGKSSIMYMTMALAQERGEIVALIDSERVFDKEWFTWLGGKPSELLIYRPRTAEEAIEVLMLFANTDETASAASVCGIDSVASMLPQEELKKMPTEGEDRTASRARMMSRLLRRVTAINERTLFIWTNQVIDRVTGYGGTTTPGGRALKFYASARIELKKLDKHKRPRKMVKKGKIVKADKVIGQWVAVRAVKQKTAKPEGEGMFLFDIERKRIDHERELLYLALEDGLVTRRGNTFEYEDSDEILWTGVESRFLAALRENSELSEELEWAVQERSRTLDDETEEGDDGDDEDL